MNELLMKLVEGTPVGDPDLVKALFKLCADVHGMDCDSCPVYENNHGKVKSDNPYAKDGGCACFKDGQKMLDFLRDTDKKGSGWPHWHLDNLQPHILLEMHENESYHMYSAITGESGDDSFGRWPYPWPVDETRYARISEEEAHAIIGKGKA
jgi:hypothetical protein